jgi:hypothetical protein
MGHLTWVSIDRMKIIGWVVVKNAIRLIDQVEDVVDTLLNGCGCDTEG